MPKSFFPPLDATEAMSNWIHKPAAWMAWCRASPMGPMQQIAKLEPVIVRLASSVIIGFTAPMDLVYNVVWLGIETGVVCLRPLLARTLGPQYENMCREVKADGLAIRGKKCGYYFTAMLFGPFAVLAVPVKVQNIYREREMIVSDQKSHWQLFLEQLRSGQQLALRKVEDGVNYVRNHPKKSTAATLSLAALGTLALRLRQQV